MKKNIYLDYAATTPLDPKVLRAMLPYLKKEYGNPSSSHAHGQRTRAAIEKARTIVAEFCHCSPQEIVFTSGASEANNLVIQGVARARHALLQGKVHIVTSCIEHESVLSPLQGLERAGIANVSYLSVNAEGQVSVEDVRKALQENTVLVSVMYANSEIGTVQPVSEIGEMLRKRKISFHTDAVQAAHYLSCNVEKLGVSFLTLSSHKVYGPKGIGVLYMKQGVPMEPMVLGGGQEQGFRSGTENTPAIVGMGTAFQELQSPRMQLTNITIRQLRDRIIKEVLRLIPRARLTGSREKRLPNNAHFTFEGLEGRDLVLALDQKGFSVSTGSACSEKNQEPSHVLLALGLSPQEAMASLRVTLGKYTKQEEVTKFLRVLPHVVEQLRNNTVYYT